MIAEKAQTAQNVEQTLYQHASLERASNLQRFFKTGPGEYGENDEFIGVNVPYQRTVAKQFYNLSLTEVEKLLSNKYHECRLTALFILRNQFEKADSANEKIIYNFYLKNISYINNWDLVDSSASYIVGNFLLDKPRKILYDLAKSSSLWEQRISIISTQVFIKNNQFNDTLKLAKIFLTHKHDLMHKAVGWMLREVGKKDEKVLENFLNKNANNMPRTMLRYSIERLPEKKRKYYLLSSRV